jgi:hypothetical protein
VNTVNVGSLVPTCPLFICVMREGVHCHEYDRPDQRRSIFLTSLSVNLGSLFVIYLPLLLGNSLKLTTTQTHTTRSTYVNKEERTVCA